MNIFRNYLPIDQFRYIKIQSQTIDLSTRLMAIATEFVRFIPKSLVLKSIVVGWILIYRNWSISRDNNDRKSYWWVKLQRLLSSLEILESLWNTVLTFSPGVKQHHRKKKSTKSFQTIFWSPWVTCFEVSSSMWTLSLGILDDRYLFVGVCWPQKA